MESDKKELRVGPFDNYRKTMYLAKELLQNTDQINIISGTNSAPNAAKAAETLVRLGYVTYTNIQTSTSVDDKEGRRQTRLIISVKKTANFKKLYDENEAKRKEKEAERAKEKEKGEEKKEEKK